MWTTESEALGHFNGHRPCWHSGAGESDALQPGSRLLAAAYALYSSATMVVLSLGAGTHGFTLDAQRSEFVLTHPNIRIPARGAIISRWVGFYPRVGHNPVPVTASPVPVSLCAPVHMDLGSVLVQGTPVARLGNCFAPETQRSEFAPTHPSKCVSSRV